MKKGLFRMIAILLAMCLLVVSFAGWGKETVTSTTTDNGDVYGDAVDYEDGDEDVNVRDSQTITNSTGGKVTDGVASKPKTEYKVDESAKKDFLESIPKELSGKTVEILIWWNPSEAENAKMKEFTKKTGIKVKFVTTTLDGYYQKLSAMINQGNSPDLACIVQSNFPACVMQDYFSPLSEGKFDLTDKIYDIDTMNMFKYNDKYYGAMIKGSTNIETHLICFDYI